jgi:uncharacterized SAM-binding protein YcdF (DUF218 family)
LVLAARVQPLQVIIKLVIMVIILYLTLQAVVLVLGGLLLLEVEGAVQVPEDTPQIVADLVVVVDMYLLLLVAQESQGKEMLAQTDQLVALAGSQAVGVVLAQ